MGAYCSNFSEEKEVKLLMLGLDGAGKTTILYKLKLNANIFTFPTVGFNMESFKYQGVKFTIWDAGGQNTVRSLWNSLYRDTQGLIFVVDSSDRKRISEAKEELMRVLKEEELSGTLLLILANKQDISDVMSLSEISEKLGLQLLKNRKWNIKPACSKTGEGLKEGLSWLKLELKI